MDAKRVIIIYGPTGSGKTDLAISLASAGSGEIINADVGQFYEPLSIGTAKPAWQTQSAPHHLFDIMKEPAEMSVVRYRELVHALIEKIHNKGRIPLIVGGSGFYIMSLFFPPFSTEELNTVDEKEIIPDQQKDLWNTLYEIDPVRAAQINPQDHYRLQRAIMLWKKTGVRPSACKPIYQPLDCDVDFIVIDAQGLPLRHRIQKRMDAMFAHGWIDEVKKLYGTPWHAFLLKKKLLGYDDILHALEALSLSHQEPDWDAVKNNIVQKTMAYAKRQRTFGNMMIKKIMQEPNVGIKFHRYAIDQLSVKNVCADLQLACTE